LATPPTTHPADADDSLKAAKLAPATPEPSTVAAAPAPQQLVDQAPPSTVPSDTESSIQSGTAPSAAPLLPSPDTSQGNAAAAVPFVPPAPEPPHPLPEPPRSADSGSVRKSDIPTRPVPPRDTHQRQPNRSSDAAKAAERRTDARATDNAGIQEALNRLKGAMPDRDNAAPANSVPDAPPAYPVTSISADVGLLCRSLTPETAQEVGLDSPQGLLVTGVTVGGPADQAGIRANDVILKANGSDIRSIAGLRVAPGQSVAVEILRDRRVITLHLRSAS
jgi:S1-C subfamily serine protease